MKKLLCLYLLVGSLCMGSTLDVFVMGNTQPVLGVLTEVVVTDVTTSVNVFDMMAGVTDVRGTCQLTPGDTIAVTCICSGASGTFKASGNSMGNIASADGVHDTLWVSVINKGSATAPNWVPYPNYVAGEQTAYGSDAAVFDLHSWAASSLSLTGFAYGLGAGVVFGGGFLLVYYMRRVFKEVDGD